VERLERAGLIRNPFCVFVAHDDHPDVEAYLARKALVAFWSFELRRNPSESSPEVTSISSGKTPTARVPALPAPARFPCSMGKLFFDHLQDPVFRFSQEIVA